MPSKTNIILVGVGRMGRNHLRVIRESPHFELRAVVDSVASTPPDVGVPLLRSLAELQGIDYDAAVIATPTASHDAIAIELAGRGKHLLVEKPLAPSFRRCQDVIAACEASRVKLAVGHVERLNPAVRKLRELIVQGSLGTPIHFSMTRVGGYPTSVPQDNNVLLDLAVHDIDVLRSMLGPLKVEASTCHASVTPGVCDTAEILLSSATGASATVHVNWITPTKIRTIRVTGTRGVCFVDYILQSCSLLGGNLLRAQVDQGAGFDRLVELYKSTDRIEFGIDKEEPLKLQLALFHALIHGGSPGDLCLGTDGSSAVLVAERAIGQGQIHETGRRSSPPPVARMPTESDEWV